MPPRTGLERLEPEPALEQEQELAPAPEHQEPEHQEPEHKEPEPGSLGDLVPWT
jgi:hypothetical protein